MTTNTNANNDKAFNMDAMGKALDTPVDERSSDWASSTLSALGPTATSTSTTSATSTTSPGVYPSTLTTHPTISATHTLDTLGSASESETAMGTGTDSLPVYSHKSPNPNPTNSTTNSNSSTVPASAAANEFTDSLPPPISSKTNPFLEDHTTGHTSASVHVPSTATFSPDIDLGAGAPTLNKELTSTYTQPPQGIHFTSSTHTENHPAPSGHFPSTSSTSPTFSSQTQTQTHAQILESASTASTPGLHIPGAYPGMEKERMTDGDLEAAKRAAAAAMEKVRATGGAVVGVVTEKVVPAVRAYIPSAQTTKDATMNAGTAAAETVAPYIPTAEQTKDAAITAGQATANAGVAAGKSVGNTAANAASYIPEVHPADTTRSYLASAGDVIRSYVPASVSAYLPGSAQPITTTTLPSQETGQNAHPASSDGAGTLPGPPGEIGVAVLPDERTGAASASTPASNSHAHDAHTHTHTDKATTESGGVGILPGEAAGESGVALLPLERASNAQAAVGPRDDTYTHTTHVSDRASESAGLEPKAALVAAIPGAEHYDAVNINNGNNLKATNADGGNGSVAFVEPPFEPTTNVYINSPPPPSSSSSSSSSSSAPPDSLLNPAHTNNDAGSTLGGASADASIRSLAGSKIEQQKLDEVRDSEETPITTTTNSVPHPEPTAVNSIPTRKNEVKPTPPPKDVIVDAHHQDSTTATQGHGSTFNASAATTASNMPTHSIPNPNTNPNADATSGAHTLSTTRSPDTDPASGSHAKSASSTSTSGDSGAGKKPSLLSKMKGEMKVLSGKIGHNEEKIEEGRRMMGKTLN